MTSIVSPPIARIATLAQAREQTGAKVIRLGQAVPWYGPPEWALAGLASGVHAPELHRYSPDPGLPEVRQLLSDLWFTPRRLVVDPATEIHLTTGASQAFLGALTAVADPGQRVVLTDPYYFDHLFAVQFLALTPRFVPMREDESGFHLNAAGIISEIRSGCAAVVVVDPANPTGSVVEECSLRLISEACAASGTALILDETYERITFSPPRGWHPWRDARTRGVTILVGSFSKSLGMAGWRLGYLIAPPHVMEQALKVHDCVAICAPVSAQVLLRLVLEGPFEEWMRVRLDDLDRRRRSVRQALEASSFFRWRPTGGGIFSFLPYRGTSNSLDTATRVLSETGVALIPGSAFGPAGEGHLRLSFGSTPATDFEEALARLAAHRQ
ncbi:MAG: pyridoxal phosphate-dependent aminotransferase [Candidatus Eisenbacteria bacterium]|nr:pyridoxal phosphate-dependent aminotransferase [Candidatus Eisenbacteria bacterium]